MARASSDWGRCDPILTWARSFPARVATSVADPRRVERRRQGHRSRRHSDESDDFDDEDLDDNVVIGGMVGIHQFVRIGRLVMLGGYSKVVQDVPPFMMADGRPADVVDLNVRGLRRAGIPAAARTEIKQAYKLLYRSNLNVSQALEAIEEEVETNPEVEHLVEFIKQIGEGGFGRANDRPRR